MTKEFVLQGLHCAGCASKIEKSIQNIEGVLSATINMATSKLRLELAEDSSSRNYDGMPVGISEGMTNGMTDGISADIHTTVESLVHSYEPDVLVHETTKPIETETVSRRKILWLVAGALTFAAGILFEYVLSVAGSGFIALGLFTFSYLLLGGKVLLRMVKNIAKGRVFDENFLMGVATVGAIAIGKFPEAVTVMLFYQVGEFFQELAVARSKKRIGALMDIRPDYANILVDGQVTKVDPNSVQIGDSFIVKPGEKVPLDGIVLEGEAMLDTTALTGESVPRKANMDDAVLSGCINLNGVLVIQATQTFGESTVSKILDLVENAASKKAPTETFITKFARFYTPAVVCFAVLLATIPPLFFGGEWSNWISRGLIFLVISCPCALVVSIPLGFFGGIGGASKRGILVKGGNYLEALANLETVVFDKTGTLTKGVFKVTGILPGAGFTKEQVLEMAAAAEAFSNHPIATSIVKEYGEMPDRDKLTQYEEIAGYGVSVCVSGLPLQSYYDMRVLAGNEKLMTLNSIEIQKPETIGTKVYIAVDGTYAGCIVISDEIKPDSRKAITALKSLGVKQTVMLSGDIPEIAEAVADELAIDQVHASLLPQQKVEKVEEFIRHRNKKNRNTKRPRKTLAFVGDGINDAPVLAMADIGVAMGGLGSDAAIEAADVVLMTDEPAKLAEAVEIARFTKRVVWQNIIMSLGIKFLFLLLATLGVSSLWEAIFADVGVSLLAVLNSMRVLKR